MGTPATDDYVNSHDIAARWDPPITRQHVERLATRTGFPRPTTIANRTVWRWSEVEPWLRAWFQENGRGRVIRLGYADGQALTRIARARGLDATETVVALIHEERARIADATPPEPRARPRRRAGARARATARVRR